MRNPNIQPPVVSNETMSPILSRAAAAGFLLVVLMAVSGCATSEDTRTEAGADTAWLVADAPVWVHAIDGKKISNGLAGEKRFAVSPGLHTIMVKYVDVEVQTIGSPFPSVVTPSHPYGEVPGGYGERVTRAVSNSVLPVSFIAEAGHTYYVKDGTDGGDTWHPHVTEFPDPVFQDLKTTPSFAPSLPPSGAGH
jgi:hypothetical protein